MYKTRDYIHNGVLYLNNIIRPHHKQLSTLMIYSTPSANRAANIALYGKNLKTICPSRI